MRNNTIQLQVQVNMPRTFLNTVRGYKDQTYWENQTGSDCQNVMKTRSGLRIKTVPRVRRSNSRTNTRTIPNQQVSSTQDSPKCYRISRNCPINMSYLSFVTRYNMLASGTKLNLTEFPNNADECATVEREIVHQKRDHAIDNIAEDFRAQLMDLGLYECTELTGEGMFKNFVQSSTVTEESESPMNKESSKFIDQKCMNIDYRIKTKTRDNLSENIKNSTDQTYSAEKDTKSKEPISLSKRTQDFSATTKSSSGVEQPILSKTKVLLTVNAGSNPGQSHPSCSLAQNNLIQAQLASGQPLLFNSIPVMIVNRIPSTLCVTPSTSGVASPWKLNAGLDGKISNTSPKTLNFSPRRRLRCDTDTDSNLTDTDDDGDSSDTCSQGSQDSNISDFDLSIFQMESHSFSQDAKGNQIHKCKLCDRVFTVFHAFKTHVNSHVKVKNRCTICGKIFSRSWLLKGHMRTHTGEKPFACPHPNCQKRFADKSNLRSHQLIHTITDKTYICPKCNRAFAQKRYLHKHRLEVCKF